MALMIKKTQVIVLTDEGTDKGSTQGRIVKGKHRLSGYHSQGIKHLKQGLISSDQTDKAQTNEEKRSKSLRQLKKAIPN